MEERGGKKNMLHRGSREEREETNEIEIR